MNKITEKNHTFFLVTPINLESFCELELTQKFALYFPSEVIENVQILEGGIEFDCPLEIGLSLNHILRTPTRILTRIAQFKCRDFPKLFNKISKINWAPWMIGQRPLVQSSAINSRIFDSRKIEKAVADGVVEFYKKQPVKKKYIELNASLHDDDLPCIYIRIVDDLCTVSIDTTGSRLHLRGEKTFTGHAPIRENLAAILLMSLAHYADKPLEEYHLIDPMCGSGTFLYECTHFYKKTFERKFAYHYFPFYLENKGLLNLLPSHPIDWFTQCTGYDIDPSIIEKTKISLPGIPLSAEDLFSNQIKTFKNAIVITNPPYGIRIGENIDESFFYKCINSIFSKFQPKLLGIIIPAQFKIIHLEKIKIVDQIKFSNGGLDVIFYILKSR